MKTSIILAAAISLMAATTLSVRAQENVGPGTVFSYTPPEQTVEEDNDVELSTDLDFFVQNGFSTPDWDSYYKFRKEVASNLVVPDWVKRTGKLPPDDALIEVTSVYLTGGDYADMVVYSHLPGDCDDTGCLVQIYSMQSNKQWKKTFQFKALAFAYKGPDDDGMSSVVAVGNADVPDHIYDWQFGRFSERLQAPSKRGELKP